MEPGDPAARWRRLRSAKPSLRAKRSWSFCQRSPRWTIFALDVQNFSGIAPLIFPAWESLPEEHSVSDTVFGARLRVLRALESGEPPAMVVTSVTAILQPVPPREERNAGTRTLKVGEDLDPGDLLDWLIERGFDRVPALEAPGEFSMHGGIVDLFPPDALDPIRVEFFGDEIESLRTFDVETQRRIEELDEITLTLLTPQASLDGKRRDKSNKQSLLASLPSGSWIGLVELSQLTEEGRSHLKRLGHPAGLFTVPEALAGCAEYPTVTLAGLGVDTGRDNLPAASGIHRTLPPAPGMKCFTNWRAWSRGTNACCSPATTRREKTRLAELLSESDVTIGEDIELCVGRVQRGFRLVSERLIVLSDHELFGRTELQRTTRRKKKNLGNSRDRQFSRTARERTWSCI